MASEDVMERADEWLRGRVHFSNHATSSPARRREIRLVYDLAAEVRELRRDKARLAALCKWVSERDCEFSVEELIAIADEELAAMGGEAQTHD